MSIFEVKNNQLQRMDAADMAQLTATDTDDILGGGAGSEVNAQALLDGITGELGTLDSGKQPKTLSTPLTIDGTSETTVEGALGGLNDYADDHEDEISAIVNVYGSKNLLKNKAVSQTLVGVTFTVNKDGTISTANTSSGANGLYLNYDLKNVLTVGQKYRLSGCPAGGSDSTYELQIRTINNGTVGDVCHDYGSGAEFTYTSDMASKEQVTARLRFAGSIDMSGKTFKPMIRDARIKDDTYVPYVPTNRDLVPWAVNALYGVHNILPKTGYTLGTTTGGTYTFTDGLHAFDVVSTGGVNSGAYLRKADLKAILSVVGVVNKPIKVSFQYKVNAAGQIKLGYGTGISAGTSWALYEMVIAIKADGTFSDLVFMNNGDSAITINIKDFCISLAEDTDETYQPYAMTNQELTDMVVPVDITGQITWGSGITINASFTKVVRIGKEILFSAYFSYNTELAADTWKEICTLPVDCVSTFFSALTRYTEPVTGLIENNTKVKITSHNIAIPSGRMCCINTVFLIA